MSGTAFIEALSRTVHFLEIAAPMQTDPEIKARMTADLKILREYTPQGDGRVLAPVTLRPKRNVFGVTEYYTAFVEDRWVGKGMTPAETLADLQRAINEQQESEHE